MPTQSFAIPVFRLKKSIMRSFIMIKWRTLGFAAVGSDVTWNETGNWWENNWIALKFTVPMLARWVRWKPIGDGNFSRNHSQKTIFPIFAECQTECLSMKFFYQSKRIFSLWCLLRSRLFSKPFFCGNRSPVVLNGRGKKCFSLSMIKCSDRILPNLCPESQLQLRSFFLRYSTRK